MSYYFLALFLSIHASNAANALTTAIRTYTGKKQNGDEYTAEFMNLVVDPSDERNAVSRHFFL